MLAALGGAALALIVPRLEHAPVVRTKAVASRSAGSAAGRSAESAAGRSAESAGRSVRLVRLRPGEKAPPGARVIQEAARAPRVVLRVTRPAVSSSVGRTRSPSVARSRQSGG